ncbi:MPPED1, partial [Acrasis kona]
NNTNSIKVEAIRFNRYIGTQAHKFKHVVVIPGNHEFYPDILSVILSNATHYLRDKIITIEGIKIYGSRFKAYNHWWPTGYPKDAKKSFSDANETDIDVFLTHQCPYFEHFNKNFFRMGNENMNETVLKIKPLVHIFGHDHHVNGTLIYEGVQFIAAACDAGANKNLRPPIVFD